MSGVLRSMRLTASACIAAIHRRESKGSNGSKVEFEKHPFDRPPPA